MTLSSAEQCSKALRSACLGAAAEDRVAVSEEPVLTFQTPRAEEERARKIVNVRSHKARTSLKQTAVTVHLDGDHSDLLLGPNARRARALFFVAREVDCVGNIWTQMDRLSIHERSDMSVIDLPVKLQ